MSASKGSRLGKFEIFESCGKIHLGSRRLRFGGVEITTFGANRKMPIKIQNCKLLKGKWPQ